MAPVPKKKHTRSRSNQRRNAASNILRLTSLIPCPSCKKLKTPHKACIHCGHYK